jgi:arylsulfatase A-like enzyme
MQSLGRMLILLLALGVFFQPASADDPPNVLFIAVDDLRDCVGHLGSHPQAKTPSIDHLAERGVSFTRAYCSAPLCNPSRISLLTGIAPSNSGVYGNGEKLRDKLPRAVTLMQHFRASGYSARGAGKIFHGSGAYDKDSWDGYFRPANSKKPRRIKRDSSLPKSAWVPWGPLDGIELPQVTNGDLDDVPAFGRKLAREVYDPSGERNFAVKPDGDHANVIANNQWRKAVQAYLATISFADAQIGRVLGSLEKSAHAENTIIVLWGDHGWHLGEKEHWRKHALWDVSTRTPLIISVPEGRTKGQRCHRPVSLIDLYPTIVDLCGLPERDGLDGQSLKPLLQNPSQEWQRPVVMTYGFNNHAVQTQRWRYIRYADGGEELYDHTNDLNEWKNLASFSQYKSTIEELKMRLPERNKR